MLNGNCNDQRKREKMLEKYNKLVQSIRDGYVLCDVIYDKNGQPIDCEIVECNLAFEKIIGINLEKLQGRKVSQIFAKLERTLFEESISWIIDGCQINFSYFSKKIKRWLEIKAYSLEKKQLITLVVDITDQKRSEKERQRINRAESVEILTGGIAHDYFNLLSSIIGYAQLASDDADEKQKLYIQEILNSANRATGLTQRLVLISKPQPPSLQIVSLGELIDREIKSLLGLRTPRSECDNKLPPNLWKIQADYERIAQVIRNLTINSLDAMPNGGRICIQGSNLELLPDNLQNLPPGKYVHILFSDEGIGIHQDHLEKIFNPYFSTKMGPRTGSGLGLDICSSTIKKHKGTITVESVQTEGTTFHIYLPAIIKEIPKKECVEKIPEIVKPLNILIMDDESSIRDLLENILETLGHKIEMSCDGIEAIERYRQYFGTPSAFDLVILDLTIPGKMSGIDTFKAIRDIDPNVKAILSSGFRPESSEIPVLEKPYTINELKMAIFRLMS